MFSSLWQPQEIDKQGVQYNSDVDTVGSTDGGGFGSNNMQLGQEQHDFWIQWFQNSIFGCAPNAEGESIEGNFTCGSPNTTLTSAADRAMRAPHPKRMGEDHVSIIDAKSVKSSVDSQYVTLSATLQDVQARVSWAPKHLEKLAGALVAVKRSGGDLGSSAMEFLSEITAPAVSTILNQIPAIDSLKRGWQRLVSFNEPNPMERHALQLVYEQSMTNRPAPHISQHYIHEIVAECKALAEEVRGAPPGSFLESMAKCLENMVGATNIPDEQVEAINTLWRHLVASWVDLHWEKMQTLPLNPAGREVFHTDMCDLWNRLVLLNRLIIHRQGQLKMPSAETIWNPYPFVAQIPPCLMDIPIYLRQSLGIDVQEIQRLLLSSCAVVYKHHFPQRNLNDFKIWYKEQISVKTPSASQLQEGWDFDDQLLEAVGDNRGAYAVRGNLRSSSDTCSNASTRRTTNTFRSLFGGGGSAKGSSAQYPLQRQVEDIPQNSELWEEVWQVTDTQPELCTTVFDAKVVGDKLLMDLKRLPAEEFVQQMIAVYICMVYRDVVTIALARSEDLPKLQGLCLNLRALIEQGSCNNWNVVCLEGIIEALREFDCGIHGNQKKRKSASNSCQQRHDVMEKDIEEDDWTLVDISQ